MYKYFNIKTDPLMAGVDTRVMQMLDEARDIAGIPFIITSGKRTAAQNTEAGGVSDSAHLAGLAVDLRCRNDNERFLIIKSLIYVGFTRIGDEVDHIHCDIDGLKDVNVIWR